MRNLIYRDWDLIEVYRSIANNCRGEKKTLLLSELDRINRRYDHYQQNTSNLIDINQYNFQGREDIKSYLIDCYDENVNLNKLKVEIKSLQDSHYKAICPYCGLNSNGTFDHYIPKEDFPDYSVLALNLIPCCEKCNSIKGKRWKKNDHLLFINYYFSIIPDQRYLYVDIEYNISTQVPTITFKLENNNDIDEEVFTVIKTHYQKLNLCSRYEEHANNVVSELYDRIKLAYEEGEDIVSQKQEITRQLRIKKDRKGINDWEVALLFAVLECEEFFVSITNNL
ncbi:HNH endonuclease [Lysinibacillus capsici]|uniref:HNH endonuclease n=1 Tax=Lysinibacillus capsici TaxID=2115968 RepID=UPI002E1F94B3|nr:hypothetical protein [Lysinibacillus capsici]